MQMPTDIARDHESGNLKSKAGAALRKIIFSSERIPAHPDEGVRIKMLRDFHAEHFGACDIEFAADRLPSFQNEVTQFGEALVTRLTMTATHYARNSAAVAANPHDDFLMAFDAAPSVPTLFQRGRAFAPALGQPVFYTNAEPLEGRSTGEMALVGVCVPRARLVAQLANADDRVLMPLDVSSPALRLLRRYIEFLVDPEEIASDPALDAHIETTLIDLISLALGARGEVAEVAGMRGLRAARIHAILSEIKANFHDPAFSAGKVAHKLGLSARYVQNLMQESGVSFTDRVMELRLQRARTMLADPRYDHLKVSDIAYACGFNEVSYFNRAFRRRFGDAPGGFRRGW